MKDKLTAIFIILGIVAFIIGLVFLVKAGTDNARIILMATPLPTGTATPISSPTVRQQRYFAPKTIYAAKRGKSYWPCTKQKPCDISTGVIKKRENIFGRKVIFSGLTAAEIRVIMND